MITETMTICSWGKIADHIHRHLCFTRMRTQNCSHPVCDYGSKLIEFCWAMESGSPTSGMYNIDDVVAWIESKTCHSYRRNRSCNHPACNYVTHLLEWLNSQKDVRIAA